MPNALPPKKALKYPPVEFNGLQARAVAMGFGEYARTSGRPIHACSVMPDHVHLVVGPGDLSIETLVIQLKGAATEHLAKAGIHPFQDIVLPEKVSKRTGKTKPRHPKAFARGEWKVFLDPDDILRAIRYVEDNPVKEGMKPQRWTFVVPYMG